MAKQVTPGSFNDPRETSKLVGGQEGYAVMMRAWQARRATRCPCMSTDPGAPEHTTGEHDDANSVIIG